MSQELERVYTINLGKVLLSVDTHRAPRAINMIKEFARHHMKTEEIKIEEDLAHQIWSRGVRSPPRKIRVRMTKTDDGFILVSPYTDETESKDVPDKKAKKD
ncbi:MAG: 50S ribosomal protein L31e, partial [Nitrosarchaeum sp.]